jgi:hypothetical protein
MRLTTHSTRAEIELLSCAGLGFNGVVCRRVNSGVRRLSLSQVKKMRHSKMLLMCLLILIPIVANAQSNSATCRVSAYWWDRQSKVGSGLMLLGQFNPTVANETTVKTFKAMDGDLLVTAGMEYELDYRKSKPSPLEVRLAITVSDKEGTNIFGSIESSEASTLFKRGWNLSVNKNLDFEGKVYTFGLRCSEGVKSAR